MMNSYLFETCRGQFNWNKLMGEKKCASCWSFSRMCITMHGSENVKLKNIPHVPDKEVVTGGSF